MLQKVKRLKEEEEERRIKERLEEGLIEEKRIKERLEEGRIKEELLEERITKINKVCYRFVSSHS